MKRVILLLLLAASLFLTCSKDKGTDSQSKPMITLSTQRVDFTAVEMGTQPRPLEFIITNSGKGTLSATISEDCDWFSLSASQASLDPGKVDTVLVIPSTHSLSPGNYLDTVMISCGAAANSPQRVIIALQLAQTELAIIAYKPAHLLFGTADGGPEPASQQVVLYNHGRSTLNCNLSRHSTWLQIDSAHSQLAPGDSQVVTVQASSANKGAGLYRDTIYFVDANAVNSPQRLDVLLSVAEDSTLVIMDSLSNSWTNTDVYKDSIAPHLIYYRYLYLITCSWRSTCYSNVGKSVQVFAYVGSDTSNQVYFGETNFRAIHLGPGESLPGAVSFGFWVWEDPPPLNVPWFIWVKYLVDGVEYSSKVMFIPNDQAGKTMPIPVTGDGLPIIGVPPRNPF